MEKKQRFSLRKYKIGMVSVLLGTVLMFSGAGQVSADQVETTTTQPTVEQVVSTAVEEPSIGEDVTTVDVAAAQTVEEAAVVTDKAIVELPDSQTETASEAPQEEAATEDVVTVEPSEALVTDEGAVAEKTQDTDKVTPAGKATPQNIDSNAIITVPETWNKGYKGEGMVVAIIDSGLDPDHDVLQITDIDKAKYHSEDEIEAAKKAAGITYGKWFNNKVIFGYNYVDANTILKQEDKSSHGMHVTGIATGNPTKPVGNELIYGVAPEAQVMFMRVFSDLQSTTGPALYVKAIDDAVKLGADSINLSLGGASGSVIDTDGTVTAAIARARAAGVSVVIAAGNDGAFGSGVSNPWAENPDYGLVGDPSTAKDAISVASYNNTTIMSEVVNIVGLEDNAELNHGLSSYTKPGLSKDDFELGKEYEYEYVGTGTVAEVEGHNLKGKLALIKRGDITFSEKIANAAAKGAVGVVIFNHTPGAANLSMSLDESGTVIPSIFIPYEFGEAMAANSNYKLLFNNSMDKLDNPEAGVMSDFTSWGLSADGDLKPDLAAPGGSIYASINDSAYETMSGTSMATPHVAGAAVLVKEYLKKAYPEKSASEIENLIKLLMMSTAKPHFNKETNAYTSPRQQGSGILDTASAIATGLYVTGEDGYGSVTLGNVEDTFEFTVTLHNITDQDKTLTYVTHLDTDGVEDGLISLKPRELKQVTGETITVKANSSETVTISLDASEFAKALTEQMPNGYYLEGFVRFLDAVDSMEVVSIPYVGFRGQFQDLAVVEQPVYEHANTEKGGFYFKVGEDKIVPQSENYTTLVTTSSDYIFSVGEQSDMVLKALGTFTDASGNSILELNADGNPVLAISPNGNQNQDSVAFKGVFLRNYVNLKATVYAADDTDLTTPLWTSEESEGPKNYYGDNPKRPKSRLIYDTEWDGTDQNGQALADGTYKYVVSYRSMVPGSEEQRMIFDVILDREAPDMKTATYDETTQTFKPRAAVERGASGIYRDQVFYLVKDDNGSATLLDQNPKTGALVILDDKVYVERQEDGSFVLPLDKADLSDFYYIIEDYAGNRTWAKVADLISIGNENGIVTVNIYDKETDSAANVDFSYSVKDSKGNIVTNIARYKDDVNTLKLPFGTYTFDLFLYDEEWATITGETSFTVTLSEENSVDDVIFYVNSISKGNFIVDIDQNLPKGTTVTLVNAAGGSLVLPQAKYSKTDYGKFVPTGDYTIAVDLPKGYEFLEDLSVTVTREGLTRKVLTLLNKTALLEVIAAQEPVVDTPAYYNASEQAIVAYQEALKKAQEVVATKVSQAEIDKARAELLTAKTALDGKETDVTALEQAVSAVAEVVNGFTYVNGSSESQVAYDAAVKAAQLVLATANVKQVEVDDALKVLEAARENLDGKATDMVMLRNQVSKANVLKQTSAKYQNASDSVKAAYDTVVAKAQELLETPMVSQAEVDAVLAELMAAEAALDGVEVPTTVPVTPAPTTDDKETTPTTTPPNDPSLVGLAHQKGGQVAQKQRPDVGKVAVATVVPTPITNQQSVPAPSESLENGLPATGDTDSKVVLGMVTLLVGTSLYWTRKVRQED